MRPERLAALGVSEPRPGQRFAFIMDTRMCEAVFALAEGADLMVCEATFLAEHAALAPEYGHLTATQAGQIAVAMTAPKQAVLTIAAESGVRTLVLTNFFFFFRFLLLFPGAGFGAPELSDPLVRIELEID
jgi:ribonuclease Z